MENHPIWGLIICKCGPKPLSWLGGWAPWKSCSLYNWDHHLMRLYGDRSPVSSQIYLFWLVVSTPLKNMNVSWDYYIFSIYGQIKMFQTTNQYLIISEIFSQPPLTTQLLGFVAETHEISTEFPIFGSWPHGKRTETSSERGCSGKGWCLDGKFHKKSQIWLTLGDYIEVNSTYMQLI